MSEDNCRSLKDRDGRKTGAKENWPIARSPKIRMTVPMRCATALISSVILTPGSIVVALDGMALKRPCWVSAQINGC